MIAYGQKIGPREIRLYLRYTETLEKFNQGDRIRLKIERDRHGKFNSLYHVLVSLLVKAINSGPAQTTIADLKRWVKLQKGWYDVVELPRATMTGQTHAIDYKSTSFAEMGEDEFHLFAIDTCEMVRTSLAPWLTDSDEWPEIQSLVRQIAPEDAA